MTADPGRTRLRSIAIRCALVACTALFTAAAPQAHAQVVIKLGTIAPEGSVWHDALLKVRQTWRDQSGGKVELRIYAGGVLGSEEELVRKLQRRVIDAVTLSGAGLPMLDNGFNCLNLPMLFDTPDKLDYIRNGLAPAIEERLGKKGFKVLLDSLALMKQQGFTPRCEIIGDGEDAEQLKKQSAELQLSNVAWLGMRTQDEVRAAMGRAHVMALPCIIGNDGNRDALPTVLLEAQAAGLPCLASSAAARESIVVPSLVRTLSPALPLGGGGRSTPLGGETLGGETPPRQVR
jgi:glycosyltransferase involved in cell wall biosynthesis